jgi:O-antigen ligase
MPDILEARSGHLGRRTGSAPLETAAFVSLLLFAASLQVSIAAANILLGLSAVLWLAIVILNRERIEVPRMFWPLAAYAAITLVSTLFSVDPSVSFRDDKQLLLFAIVPIAYRLFRGPRALTAADVVIAVGAISAAIGVVQGLILKFPEAGLRTTGVLSMYMTYSGELMLIACVVAARAMFHHGDRTWSVIVLPVLLAALATTLTRSAWVGACAGIGWLLIVKRDFRLFAVVAVAAAAFFAFAPSHITERLFSIFELKARTAQSASQTASVESNRDRIAMVKAGLRIIQDRPLTGVGPDMIIQVYPGYRDPTAVNQLASHLHNVPMQIAAERGLPALAIWLWFVVALLRDLFRLRRTPLHEFLPTAAIACVVAMLAAGLFEYNFGDSEFLMLFLILVTLPFAAVRPNPSEAHA